MANLVKIDNSGKLRKRIAWSRPWDYLTSRPIPPNRYSTGLQSFDLAFGGGLWPNLLLVVQGAPNAGKSSFAAQLAANHVLTHGGRLYVYAPDEGARAVCVRLGQYVGIDRDDLELTKDSAIAALKAAYPDKIRLVDADDPTALLETFLDQITEEHQPNDPPPLFLLDSIQTARTDMDDTFDARRHQIEYVMTSILSTCLALPMISVCVSHINRPAFASKDPSERSDPMAAAAEAAAITRACHAMIHLEGELEEGVRAWIRKNRLHRGARPKVQLQYDAPRGAFREPLTDQTAPPDPKAQAAVAKEADHNRAIANLAADIRARLTKIYPDRLSQRQLHELVGGKRQNFAEALASLEADTSIDWIKGDRGAILWAYKPTVL